MKIRLPHVSLYLSLIAFGLFLSLTPFIFAEGADQHVGEFVSVEGRQLRVYQAGAGQDVLFIHGMPGSIEDWLHLIPELTSKYRVTAFDRPGHGKSAHFPGEESVARQADIAHALIQKLGLKNVIVVGHSYGGVVAQQMAVSAFPEIRACVLVGTVAYQFETEGSFSDSVLTFPFIGPLLLNLMGPAAVSADVREGLVDSVSPNMREVGSAFVNERVAWWSQAKIVGSTIRQGSQLPLALAVIGPKIPDIRIPAVILQGLDDVFFDRASIERLADEWRDARLIYIENTGHYLQNVHPKDVVDAIDFLRLPTVSPVDTPMDL